MYRCVMDALSCMMDASETTWLNRPKPIAACRTENHGVNCVVALQAAFLRCEAPDIS